MINKLQEVMMYVEDEQKIAEFWCQNFGFLLVGLVDLEQSKGYTIQSSDGMGSRITIFNKAFIAKMEPELELAIPSLMFSSSDLDKLYEELIAADVTVGNKVTLPEGKQTFNFADPEGNYFAICEA